MTMDKKLIYSVCDKRLHGLLTRACIIYDANNKEITLKNPTKTGYTFKGWYKEAECTNAWVFDTDTVTADTTHGMIAL